MVLVDDAVLHHERDVAYGRDVARRVAVDRHEVGEEAGLHGADPVGDVEELRVARRRRADDRERRHAVVDEQLHLAGVVANKVFPLDLARGDATVPSNGFSRDTQDEARKAVRTLQTLAARDARCLSELKSRSKAQVAHVPLMTHDVHDLPGLGELSTHILS